MSEILARTAVRIAALVLERNKDAEHQCVRIKNLDADEVIRFVKAWPVISTEAGLHKVRLVVADDLGGRIPPGHVAEPGCTITHYRNHNRQGLVYVETRIQSDEQGLQNMFTLRDSNFLDKSFDEHASMHRGIPGLLVQEAWSASGGNDRVPALLLDRMLTMLDHVHPGVVSVSVRRFVDYAEQVCRAWLGHAEAIDGACADRLIGESLWALEKLFPDAQWHEGGSDVRCRRRLSMNFRHADLMDGAAELAAEDISAKARSVRFVKRDGKPFPASESHAWAELCDQYGRDRSLGTRRQLPYEIFSQLFARDTAGLKLGDRMRVEIESAAPDRLVEFDSLDLTAGLNARNNHAAVQLQEATPPPVCRPLIELASAKTRKSIERLAVPPRRRFFNPAIEIVRQAQRVQADLQDERIARLVVELVDGGEDISRNPSVGLFAFLFGSTLESIATECDGMSGGCQLLIDERLLLQHEAPKRPSNDDDAAEGVGDELAWNPVALKFIFTDTAGHTLEVVDQLEWCPAAIEHFALLWLLAVAPGSPALTCAGTLRLQHVADIGNWLAPFVSRQSDLVELTLVPDHELADPGPLMREFVQMRLALKESFSTEGISIPVLQTFLDAWRQLLLEARQQFIPDGVRLRELEAFLGTDLLQIMGSERRMMLAFHPIRLRWICGYLQQTRKLACDFLSGEAAFADGEGRFYLDWLEDLTPRESPPVAVGHQGQLLYSRSEVAWCDDFSPQRTDTGDISCDDEAIAAISARIANYLEAHPYKRDGLSLLVVLPSSDTTPAEILRRVLSGAGRFAPVRISIVVAAPKRRWEAIARAVEAVAGDDGDAPRTRLFPDRDLSLVDYESGGSLGDFLSDQQIDIAVVTHVLQEQIISQQNTEAPAEHAGAFDPLAHRPLRIETGSGGSMSLVMLPKYSDPILESWSTLVVRSNRCKPVAPGQPENTDLIELRVSFQDSAKLFHDLHAHCHWVITLERHITREQIESIEAGAPDVLSIEDGVGANRLSTLIVSSRTGRDLVRSRLVRKLQRLLPSDLGAGQDTQRLAVLADGVYESTRRFSPRLALQALGVARFTEEIIGLTVARHLADERFPVCMVSGISAWLSLDEHVGWFGGSDQVRADMCRLSLELGADGSIAADVLILEGKLRQSYDAHGVLQVRRTCSFFRSILGGQGVDAAMWRELLASAIESVAHDVVRVWVGDAHEIASESIRERTLSALRIGPVSLRGVGGVYSICLWDCDDEHVRTDQAGDVVILQSGRCHLVNLLSEHSSLAADVPRDVGDCEQISRGGAILEDLPPPDNTSSHEAVVVMEEHPPADTDPDRTLDNEGESGNQVPVSDVVGEEAGLIKASPLRRRLPEEVLRRIYESVLGCFDMHGVSVSAVRPEEEPFLEGPASILFKVRPAAGIDPRKLFEKGAALKLALSLAQEQNVSFGIDRGVVTIDVPKSQEQRYFVDAAETWLRWKRPESGLAVPIGEDRFGELVELNFSSSNTPHLLVAGTTGSGKSEALNTILFGLVRHYAFDELRLMLVDPKGTELAPFENSRYLEGQIGWDDSDALQLLVSAVEEMQRRYLLFREASRRSLIEYNAAVPAEKRLPWWLIVLDEYADLTHDPQSKKAIEGELKRLAQKARAAGIHVIIATQKPSAEVISTNLRSNLPSQLALRVKSAIESRVVIDEAGAENLNGKGDALLKADGRLLRIQCSRVDPVDMVAVMRSS